MKTKRRLNLPANTATIWLGLFAALLGVVMVAASATPLPDAPTPSTGHFGGIYKVTSSTDPLLQATGNAELFLDFGRGIETGKLAGTVAVSLRQNPNVKVRILVWQYFPEQGVIVLGNSFAEGSRKALVRGAWRMRVDSQGVIFKRETYQVVLRRADPNDY